MTDWPSRGWWHGCWRQSQRPGRAIAGRQPWREWRSRPGTGRSVRPGARVAYDAAPATPLPRVGRDDRWAFASFDRGMSFVRFPAGGNLWRPPVEDRAAAGEPLLFREHRDLLLDRSPVFLRRVAVEEVVEVRQAPRDPTTSINDAAHHGLTVADGPGARRRSRAFGSPTRATIAGVSRESEAERPESQTVAPQAVFGPCGW